MNFIKHKQELNQQGYSITPKIYSKEEVKRITDILDKNVSNSKDLFAIRQLLLVLPELKDVIFTQKFMELKNQVSDESFFLTKAIYFNKPENSNWFVSYHQDISINVTQKTEVEGYKNWTFKKEQYGVQPPTNILENIITIRIHLDDTNEENGALRVIPKSHLNGINLEESSTRDVSKEQFCLVSKGATMLMKPLTLHASNRTTNSKKRRVIHLEFSNQELALPLLWKERE